MGDGRVATEAALDEESPGGLQLIESAPVSGVGARGASEAQSTSRDRELAAPRRARAPGCSPRGSRRTRRARGGSRAAGCTRPRAPVPERRSRAARSPRADVSRGHWGANDPEASMPLRCAPRRRERDRSRPLARTHRQRRRLGLFRRRRGEAKEHVRILLVVLARSVRPRVREAGAPSPRRGREPARPREERSGERADDVSTISESPVAGRANPIASAVWYARTSARSSTRSPAVVSIHSATATCFAARCASGNLAVGDITDERMPEAVLRARRPSTTGATVARVPCERGRGEWSPPRTDRDFPWQHRSRPEDLADNGASCRSDFASAATVSSRAAISACRESGNGTSPAARRLPFRREGHDRAACARTPRRTAGCHRLARESPAASRPGRRPGPAVARSSVDGLGLGE